MPFANIHSNLREGTRKLVAKSNFSAEGQITSGISYTPLKNRFTPSDKPCAPLAIKTIQDFIQSQPAGSEFFGMKQ